MHNALPCHPDAESLESMGKVDQRGSSSTLCKSRVQKEFSNPPDRCCRLSKFISLGRGDQYLLKHLAPRQTLRSAPDP